MGRLPGVQAGVGPEVSGDAAAPHFHVGAVVVGPQAGAERGRAEEFVAGDDGRIHHAQQSLVDVMVVDAAVTGQDVGREEANPAIPGVVEVEETAVILRPANHAVFAGNLRVAGGVDDDFVGGQDEFDGIGSLVVVQGDHGVEPVLVSVGTGGLVFHPGFDGQVAVIGVQGQGHADGHAGLVFEVAEGDGGGVGGNGRFCDPGAVLVQAMFIGGKGPLDAAGSQPPAAMSPGGRFEDRVVVEKLPPGGFVQPAVEAAA